MASKESPQLSIIVPALNEAAIIQQTLHELAKVLRAHPEFGSVEVLVVAANGGDNTAELARESAGEFEALRVIEPGKPVGKGRDVRAGMSAARGEKRIFLDADLATPLRHVPAMVRLLDDHDVVIGRRNLKKIHTSFRALMSRFGNTLIRTVAVRNIADTQCGFKGFRADAAEKLFSKLYTTGWGFDIEILARARQAKLQIHEQDIPDWHEMREEGLRGESSASVAYKTLRELCEIRLRLMAENANARRGWWRIGAWAVPLIFLAIAGALSAYRISEHSVWFDEGYSIALSQQSIPDVVRYTSHDVHPPLYYLLLKGWMGLFGQSDVALRSLSAVSMVAAIGIGYLLVKRLFGRVTALVALPFMTFSPFLIRYAQEARMYGLAALICIAATYALVRATERTAQARAGWWSLYAVLVVLGLYTHYYTALVWIAHWLWRGAMVHSKHPGWRAWLRHFFSKPWIAVHIAIVAAFAPWIPIALKQANSVQSGFWIGPVDHREVTNVFSNFLLFRPESMLRGWWSLVLMAGFGVIIFLTVRAFRASNTTTRRGLALLTLYAFAPIIVLYLVSLPPHRSVFTSRYFSEACLGFYALVGVGVAFWLRSKRALEQKLLLAAALLAMFIVGVSNVYLPANGGSRAKQVVAYATSHAHPGDVIVADAYHYYEISHYASPLSAYFYDSSHIVGRWGSVMFLQNTPEQVDDLPAFGAARHQIWYAYVGDTPPQVPGSWQATDHYQARDYHIVRYLIP